MSFTCYEGVMSISCFSSGLLGKYTSLTIAFKESTQV